MRFAGIGKSKAQREMNRILKGKDVPAFPGMAMRVLEKLRDPNVDFQKVAELLQWDPALTVETLKTVNSAAYGVRQPVEDLHHAIRFLGRGALEQIVLSVAVRGALPSTNAPGFDVERFWQAACFRAIMAKAIATRLHPSQEAESFTGALLQDLALPVLVHGIPQQYARILTRWHAQPGARLFQLEKEALGWSHDEVGGLICSCWDLPPGLTQAVAMHHNEEVGDQEFLPALRLVALISESQEPEQLDAFLELSRSSYGLNADDLLTTVESAKVQAAELAAMFLGQS